LTKPGSISSAERTAPPGVGSASPERRRGYEQCHAEIVTALTERDADAAREHMRRHLVDVRTNLLGAH
jgi:DNA-binding GntR family transcriptional regulator